MVLKICVQDTTKKVVLERREDSKLDFSEIMEKPHRRYRERFYDLRRTVIWVSNMRYVP